MLDPGKVLKAKTVRQGLQMVDHAIAILECTWTNGSKMAKATESFKYSYSNALRRHHNPNE
jgi:hypothetical protein